MRLLRGLTGGAGRRLVAGAAGTCLVVWITIALWPYPPLTDRSDPEYAERFEAATLLVDEAPGLGASSEGSLRRTVLRSLREARAQHPEMTEEQEAALEASAVDAVDRYYKRTRLALRHFLAETLNSRDLRKLDLHREPLFGLVNVGYLLDPRRLRASRAVKGRSALIEEILNVNSFEAELNRGPVQLLREWGFADR